MRRVLCVDDDEDTRTMLQGLLGLVGCEVTTVATSAETLGLLARARFDLYLLDNWLPGGSGVEICREATERVSIPLWFD
jgi:two-component system OmpR family response regulator